MQRYQPQFEKLSLSEARIDQKALDRIVQKAARMTDQNDHTGAILIIAEFFGFKDLVKAIGGVSAIQNYYKHLVSGLSKISYELYQHTLARIKDKYGDEIHQQVRSAL